MAAPEAAQAQFDPEDPSHRRSTSHMSEACRAVARRCVVDLAKCLRRCRLVPRPANRVNEALTASERATGESGGGRRGRRRSAPRPRAAEKRRRAARRCGSRPGRRVRQVDHRDAPLGRLAEIATNRVAGVAAQAFVLEPRPSSTTAKSAAVGIVGDLHPHRGEFGIVGEGDMEVGLPGQRWQLRRFRPQPRCRDARPGTISTAGEDRGGQSAGTTETRILKRNMTRYPLKQARRTRVGLMVCGA